MGLRFRRSIRIMPGVRVNLSKSGVSTSFGVRGAHVTIGHGHVRKTVGLPGTGLSYTTTRRISERSPAPESDGQPQSRNLSAGGCLAILLLLGVVGIVIAVLLPK